MPCDLFQQQAHATKGAAPRTWHKGHKGGVGAVCDADDPLRAEGKRFRCALSPIARKRTKKGHLRECNGSFSGGGVRCNEYSGLPCFCFLNALWSLWNVNATRCDATRCDTKRCAVADFCSFFVPRAAPRLPKNSKRIWTSPCSQLPGKDNKIDGGGVI